MLKFVGLLVLVFLSACSKNPESVISVDYQQGVFTGSANFGSFTSDSTNTKLITFILNNNGSAPLSGSVSLDNTNYSISYSNCPAVLAVTKSCTIKVLFDPRGKSAGTYTANLNFDSVFSSLTALKESPINTEAAESAEFQLSSAAVSSINYGEISQKQSVTKSIYVKNKSTTSLVRNIGLSNSQFSLSYDACSGKTLAKGSTCLIKVTMSGSGQEGDLSADLSYGSTSSTLIGRVVTPTSPSSDPQSTLKVNLVVLDSASEITNKDMGSFMGNQSAQSILYIKNTGGLSSAPLTASLSETTNFQIVYNQCSNIVLSLNQTCQVRVLFSASGKTLGDYNATLSFDNKSLPITAKIISNTAIITYEPVYDNYGSCSALACDGQGLQNRLMTGCNQLTNNVLVGSTDLSNCSAYNTVGYLQQSCLSPEGDKNISITNGSQIVHCAAGSTVQQPGLITCEQTFHIEDNSCLSNVKQCDVLPTNALSGTQTWNVNAYDQCLIETCNGSTHLDTNQCLDNTKDCSPMELSTVDVYATSGTATWNGSSYNCQISNCQTHYQVSGNSCSPIMIPIIVQSPVNGVILGATSSTVQEGTVLNLTTAPASGYALSSWGDDSSSCGSNSNCQITVLNPITISASFSLAMCSLNSAPNLILDNVLGVSGVGQNCSITSCSPGYYLANELDSCPASPLMPQLKFSYNMTSYGRVKKLANGQMIWFGQVTQYTDPNGKAYGVPYIYKTNANGTMDETFFQNVGIGFDGITMDVSEDSLGNLYVVGQFSSFGSVLNNAKKIAKLSANGILDTTFSNNLDVVAGVKDPTSGFGGDVYKVVVNSASNAIYVVGSFTQFKNVANNARGVAKLSTSGVFDTAFSNNLDVTSGTKAINSGLYFQSGSAATGQTLVIDGSDNIYIGGNFDSFKGTSYNARYILKLGATGLLDTTFSNNLDVTSGTKATTSGFNGQVRSLIIIGSSIFGGGDFTQFKNTTNNARGLFKLSTAGVFDTTFSNNLDVTSGVKATTSGLNSSSTVYSMTTNGTDLYIGGSFTSVKGTANNARGLAKFSNSGVFDTAFSDLLDVVPGTKATTSGLGTSGYVSSVLLDNNNLIATGISVGTFRGLTIQYLINMSVTNGALNYRQEDFKGTAVSAMARDDFGNIYLGGTFTAYKGISVGNLVKLKPNGDLDTDFNLNLGSGFNAAVTALAVKNGSLYVGGSFTSFNGVANNARSIAKVSTSGVFDTAFSNNLDVISGTKDITSGLNSSVKAIVVDNNYLYIVGLFSSWQGVANNARGLVRLSTNGIFDTAFSDSLDVVSGTKATTSGFNPTSINTLVIKNNNIYLGGSFSTFKGVTNNARFLAKISTSGVLDSIFSDNLDVVAGTKANSSSVNGTVNKIVLGSDDNLYIGGVFTVFKGVTNGARYIAKMDLQGNLNQSFNDNLDVTYGVKLSTSSFDNSISDISIDNVNNYLVVVGSFSSFKGTPWNAGKIAKLTFDGDFDEEFSDNADAVAGYKTRYGSGFFYSPGTVNTVLTSGPLIYVGGTFSVYKDKSSDKFISIRDNGLAE